MVSRVVISMVLVIIGNSGFADGPYAADVEPLDEMSPNAQPLFCFEFPIKDVRMRILAETSDDEVAFGGRLDHLIVHFQKELGELFVPKQFFTLSALLMLVLDSGQRAALEKGSLQVLNTVKHKNRILILEAKPPGLKNLSSLRKFHPQLSIQAAATCRALK